MSRGVLVSQRLLADCPRGGETAVVNRLDCLRHFSKMLQYFLHCIKRIQKCVIKHVLRSV